MTLKEWQDYATHTLREAKIPEAHHEANWLICSAIEKEMSYFFSHEDKNLSSQEEDQIRTYLARRIKHEPLSRIRGEREFWSLSFFISPDTLDPRPDSETLILAALNWVGEKKNRPWRILDLGTGSGCLLISLLHELPQAYGMGVDKNFGAIEIARQNAARHTVDGRCDWIVGDWASAIRGEFDIIISNPPYIPLNARDNLERSVIDYDPHLALFGGAEGLECYHLLLPYLADLLKNDGIGVLEMGQEQSPAVKKILKNQGYKVLNVIKDFNGYERSIIFCKKKT